MFRGYYYDEETGFYYLQTRYYDPAICRFINADTFATTDIDGLLSTNMFSYCENNPVNNNDPTGKFLNTIFGAITGAVVAVVTRDPRESWKQAAARGAVTGAIAGLALDVCVATGGAGGLAIAAIGGAVSGAIDKSLSKRNVGEKVAPKELLVSAVVGAVTNFGFGHIGRAGKCVQGDTVKSVFKAMWDNTKNGFLSPKGNFVKSKALHTGGDGLFGAFSGAFITWYGNLRLGNG